MAKTFIFSVLIFFASLCSLVSMPLAQADEVEEEIRSTIPSDPENRKKSSNGDEEGEWRTMYSEKGRRVYSGGGSSSIKVDLEKKRIFTPKITFASNRATPTPESQGVIKKVASLLVKKPELTVRVEGHTDTIGYDQPNLELSQKRADKVRELLIAGGVPAERIQSVGMGDRYPIASSVTAEGQEKNRRVEIHIAEVAAGAPTPEQAPVAAAPQPPPTTEPILAVPVAPIPAPAPAPTPTESVPASPAPAAPGPATSAPEAAPAPSPAPSAIPAIPTPAPVPAPTPAPAPAVPEPVPVIPPQGP